MKHSRRTFLKGVAGSALALGWKTRIFAQEQPLRLSLPPMQDVLPISFANTQGIFAEAGLSIELVGISSGRERSAALLSNSLDGVMSDVSNLLFNRGNAEADLVITSTAFEIIDGTRQIALLASGFFNVTDVDGLLKQINDRPQNSITISRRTDLELVTDELLNSLGVVIDPEVHYADTDDLVNAATFLVGGSVLAAVLPEPLAIITEQNELIDEQFLSKSVSNFENIPLPPSLIVFRREIIEEREADVALFYEIYQQTIDTLNNMPNDTVRELAITNTLELFLPGLSRSELPQNFGESYKIPAFPQPRALLEKEFFRASDWAKGKGYLFSDVDFASSVDFRFLP